MGKFSNEIKLHVVMLVIEKTSATAPRATKVHLKGFIQFVSIIIGGAGMHLRNDPRLRTAWQSPTVRESSTPNLLSWSPWQPDVMNDFEMMEMFVFLPFKIFNHESLLSMAVCLSVEAMGYGRHPPRFARLSHACPTNQCRGQCQTKPDG